MENQTEENKVEKNKKLDLGSAFSLAKDGFNKTKAAATKKLEEAKTNIDQTKANLVDQHKHKADWAWFNLNLFGSKKPHALAYKTSAKYKDLYDSLPVSMQNALERARRAELPKKLITRFVSTVFTAGLYWIFYFTVVSKNKKAVISKINDPNFDAECDKMANIYITHIQPKLKAIPTK